ncbi:MAG: transcriptional repressor [Phycisphaerae bacterium]|nr:transcriptional repressor [Phycisphaerae bacterium]
MQEMNSQKGIDKFRDCCRRAGLKVTPQRELIYRTLMDTDAHPSAEWVYERVRKSMPTISLDTVNRTLLTLSQIGAAFVVEGSGESRRFDGNLCSHQHFKCVRCKRILDFHHEPFDNISVPEEIRKRFELLRTTVYLEGICDRCRARSESSKDTQL